MADTCRLTIGKELAASRGDDGKVTLSGLAQMITTCEHVRVVHLIPVDLKSPKNIFNLLACRHPNVECGQIVFMMGFQSTYDLPTDVDTVDIHTSEGVTTLKIK